MALETEDELLAKAKQISDLIVATNTDQRNALYDLIALNMTLCAQGLTARLFAHIAYKDRTGK